MRHCTLPPMLDFTFGPRPDASTKILSYSIKRSSLKLVRKTVKSDCYFLHVCPSVPQFAWNNSAPTGRIFTKFDIWFFFNVSRKSKLHWNLKRITGILHEDQRTFMITYRCFLIRMRNASDKCCRENETPF